MPSVIARFRFVFPSVIVILLAACNATPTPPPLSSTSIQLSWVHTVEFSGFQFAERNNLYRDAGLQVDVRPVTFDADGNSTFPIDVVMSGEADFGVVGSDAMMQARAEGKPLVAVAAIFQRSPIALISLAENNIITPADFPGKTIALPPSNFIYIAALLDNVGIDPSDVNIVELTDFTTASLIAGEMDVRSAFVTNEPITLSQQGIAYNLLVFADYGVDGYANVIFTTEDTLNNRPALVESFLRATFAGYQLALNDPEAAARLSVEYNPELNYDAELASMGVSVPLLAPADSPIGMMRPEMWQLGYELLRDGGVLDANFDPTGAYSLSILDRIYQSNAG